MDSLQQGGAEEAQKLGAVVQEGAQISPSAQTTRDSELRSCHQVCHKWQGHRRHPVLRNSGSGKWTKVWWLTC